MQGVALVVLVTCLNQSLSCNAPCNVDALTFSERFSI